jgi:hypothetical protein
MTLSNASHEVKSSLWLKIQPTRDTACGQGRRYLPPSSWNGGAMSVHVFPSFATPGTYVGISHSSRLRRALVVEPSFFLAFFHSLLLFESSGVRLSKYAQCTIIEVRRPRPRPRRDLEVLRRGLRRCRLREDIQHRLRAASREA